MFLAVIDAASLKNPTILNDFHQQKVIVQYEPESPTSKYHFIFLLQLKQSEIKDAMVKIQGEMQRSWYSFFWNESILYIVYETKFFQIDVVGDWTPKVYKEAQTFGRAQKIPDVYLDFKTHFKSYRDMVKNLG